MKIGIITQPLMGNYGCLLQNYALQHTLKEMGHDPITLDQKSWHLEGPNKYLHDFKMVIYNLLRGKKKYVNREFEEIRNYTLRYSNEFINKYIISTKKCSKDNELRDYCSRLNVEALIVGSDQVWRPQYAPHLEQSYFSFARGLNIKRIAYAASFGVDNWEYSEKQTEKCKKLVKLFDAISVRESSGVNLCENYLGVRAEHVLDPTLLLTKEDYIHIINSRPTQLSDGGLFAYILDEDQYKNKLVELLSNKLTLKPFYVNQTKELKFDIPDDLDDYTYPPVEQWLRSFMDASFVVCDSFHGMIFSIIFNKDFVVVANRRRGLSRFTSVLNQLGLEERLISDENDIQYFHSKSINWNDINKTIKEKKALSIEFLIRALG